MPNVVDRIRNAVLAKYPTATVAERGRQHVRFLLPAAPDGRQRFSLDTSIGSLHYHDGAQWQEINTDWRDSDDAAFSDMADRVAFKSYAKSDGTRRFYPRRDVAGEYIEFGLMQYWRTAGGGSWRSIPAGTKNRSLDRLSFDGTNVAVHVDCQPDRMKVHFVLKDSTAPTRVRWPVTLVGLTLADWRLTSIAEGVVVATLPLPGMVDANKVERAVSATYSGGYIEYSADASGLAYPIDVDPTVDAQVSASADDGKWSEHDTSIEPTSATDTVGNDAGTGTSAHRNLWARFSVTIPASPTIDVSYMTLTDNGYGADDKSVPVLYSAVDGSNPAAPTTYNEAENATRTTANATETLTYNQSDGTEHNTPSLNSVLQELVDSYSYASGANMLLYAEDNGASTAINYNRFSYDGYDHDTAKCPKLHIEYTESGTTLTVADASHSHTADSPALTQHNVLAVADASHAHTADNVTLGVAGNVALVIQDAVHAHYSDSTLGTDAYHAHTADNVDLVQHNALTVAAATHAHSADSPTLTAYEPAVPLVVADASHAHAADGPVLTQHNVLVAADAAHAHTADSPTLTQHNALAVQDATHAHTADGLTLTQHNVLAVGDAAHAHSAETPTLTAYAPGVVGLTVADASHAQTAESPSLTQHGALTVADAAHAHSADSPSLAPSVALSVADASHAHTAEAPALTQHYSLVVADASHAHTADAVSLAQHHILEVWNASQLQTAGSPALTEHGILTVENALHAHTAQNINFVGQFTLVVQDAAHAHTAESPTFNVLTQATLALAAVNTALLAESLSTATLAETRGTATLAESLGTATIAETRTAITLAELILPA